jgi:hypothetical protein
VRRAEVEPRGAPSPRLAVRIRHAPFGVLVLAAILATLGAGIVAGGLYLVVTDPALRWWAAVSSLLLGPLVLYVAVELVRLAHWTWLTLVIVGGLLLASSVLRLVLAPGLPRAPLLEVGVTLTALFYITRPAIRRSFGWGGPRRSDRQ